MLKAVRKDNKAEIKERFLSAVGANKNCKTYQIRSKAVESGLGWATANTVLDNALTAWKTRLAIGKPSEFAKGSEKTQDTLTRQSTRCGSCASTSSAGAW